MALLFASLFAYIETAFTALRLFKLKELESQAKRYPFLFELWEKNPQRILITILVINNFAHVLASVLIADILEGLLGPIGMVIGVACATVLILMFGDIIPKTLAKGDNTRLFASTLWLINALVRIVYPVVTLLMNVAEQFFKFFGTEHSMEGAETLSEKEIEFLIDYSDQKGIMETEKTEMLQNVFDLGQKAVSKIMIPQTDMTVINSLSTIDDAVSMLTASSYSRLPVYEGNEQNIIGLIYHKDIFEVVSYKVVKTLKEVIRPILFIPETKKCNQLLSEFLKKRMHMAIVIDEYGVVSGLVTLEDLLEEIVGEIADEREKVYTGITRLDKGGWLVDSTVDLEKLEGILNLKFAVEDSVSLGGFMTEQLQRVPEKGERLVYGGYCFQVQQATPKRITQVLVFPEGGSFLGAKHQNKHAAYQQQQKRNHVTDAISQQVGGTQITKI